MSDHYFLKVIKNLRQNEEIMLYGNILLSTKTEDSEVSMFLKKEYQAESLNYPYQAPVFDEAAALWAAKTVYVAAQLILYRENKDTDLELLLPAFPNEITAAAILSADLCLRFLPPMLVQLKLIDSEDKLIEVLETKLHQWSYSGISSELDFEKINFATVTANKCLLQLYADRIIEYKKIKPALLPQFKQSVQAGMGIFTENFWNEFETALKVNQA